MIICSMPECRTTAGCKCSEWSRRVAASRPARSDKPRTDVRALIVGMGYDPFMMAVDELFTIAKSLVDSEAGNELDEGIMALEGDVKRLQKEIERERCSRASAHSRPHPPTPDSP